MEGGEDLTLGATLHKEHHREGRHTERMDAVTVRNLDGMFLHQETKGSMVGQATTTPGLAGVLCAVPECRRTV